MKRFLNIAAALALSAALGWSLDTSKLKPTGYVNDFAHKLDAGSAQALEAYCANLESTTGVQMAIVLVDSLDDEPVEDVANRLYREWGVGKKGANEGLLILLSMKEHKSRVEVGYGLEPIVTDGFSGGVLRDIRPILRQGNYGGGLLAAAEEFGNQIAQAKGVALAVPQAERPRAVPGRRVTGIPFPLILLGLFFLISLLGRGRGGGSGTGFLTGMLLGNMMGGRGGWGGGGFGGYDSGGGGGGGFGGFGGGDSGGGGASGGW
jgi:uncharacterized protein